MTYFTGYMSWLWPSAPWKNWCQPTPTTTKKTTPAMAPLSPDAADVADAADAAQTQVRVLSLHSRQDDSSKLYRLRQRMVLQFRLGPSLLGGRVRVYTNHPEPGHPEAFDRETFRQLQWSRGEGDHAAVPGTAGTRRDSVAPGRDDTAAFINLRLVLSGSFRFYFECDGEEDANGSGYFLVDPLLSLPASNGSPPLGDEIVQQPIRTVGLDGLRCQTVMAKNLGAFKSWRDKLRVTYESGYNMIHFTPVQALGGSGSGYSLRDQLRLDPAYQADWDDVSRLVEEMHRDWQMFSICDIVLNHTANETEWILDQPDATFNCANSPHLRPAFLMDRVLFHLSLDIERGRWAEKGIPKGRVDTEEHLEIVRRCIYDVYFPKVKLYEFFTADTARIVEEFERRIVASDPPSAEFASSHSQQRVDALELIPDPEYRRFGARVDLDLALQLYNTPRPQCPNEELRIKACSRDLRLKLTELNRRAYDRAWSHLNAAVDNVIKGARYQRVDPAGPRVKECGGRRPLVCRYFATGQGEYFVAGKHNATGAGETQTKTTLEEEEAMMYKQEEGSKFMAHNGWVMNHDPLVNFALPGSDVYLRRELVAWGDSVKLRFGDRPQDSPFLWDYMRRYAEQTARTFHGIRLDNCHSTPIHVAEYMLDAARRVRPNLYVIAELFTSSEKTDNLFINRLGINSLIREAMSAWSAHEQGRQVHRYGGNPVGSFIQPKFRPLVPSMAHALFFDQTHDNPSPVEKRTVYDQLPSSALVAMACCGSGSNRGYDELVPHHIHVVSEPRPYAEWSDSGKGGVNLDSGLIAAKRALNRLHAELAEKNLNELYVDQMDADVVAVTRHCPLTHESYVMVAHTVFSKSTDAAHVRHIKPLDLQGRLHEIVLEARLVCKAEADKFKKCDDYINGMANYTVEMDEHIHDIDGSKMCRDSGHASEGHTSIDLHRFPPGSVIVFRFQLLPEQEEAAKSIHEHLSTLGRDLQPVCHDLSLNDINRVLFRCENEEREDGGGGVYELKGYGKLPYAGLQGVVSILSDIRPINDLGNWLPSNLREGDWMMDYISQRLEHWPGTRDLGNWMEQVFQAIKLVPRYLIPRYFDAIVTGVYLAVLKRTWSHMSPFVSDGSGFVKALALGTVQHSSVVQSAPLPPLSARLSLPSGLLPAPTLAAGLPHFSSGYMRSWGRDTFISLRGLYILTGRHQEARCHILGYAACLRHGLIPNLLDGGKKARFNCRDAVWWWMYCVACYVDEVPDGHRLLKDPVARLFPSDDSVPDKTGTTDQRLEEVILEALQRHFQGLKFRERNAGRQIDAHMADKGFDNEIGVDLETGFVFGGNVDNCGTWMDKMGSSDKAGNRGRPATPRDGSAVELVGLSYACLRKLSDFSRRGHFYADSVTRQSEAGSPALTWTLDQWADRIRANFEPRYFVVRDNPLDKRPDLVNKTGIYKDTLNSGQPWTDYQLRCNFPVAMAVAPDLFDREHAWQALQIAKDKLLGPLGMATLDPDDWAYRGDYDNSNDSADASIAHGFNYHQGPEWVWPVGFFLRAYLRLALESEDARHFVMSVVSAHFVEVQRSHWRGLPELTNGKGRLCPGSNPTQAWSMACLLEVLHELQ